MSILISDPGEEVRQKAAFMVEAMADHRQFVADAADSLVRLLYKLMGVESCARHVLREDGTIIRDVKNGNSNDALHDDDDDDTKENDDEEMEMEVDYGDYDSSSSPPPSWPFIISANPNPSSNKMMTMRKKKKPETISGNVIAVGPSRKRKPLSPKFNSPSVLNLMSPSEATTSTAEEEEEEEEERPRLSHSPAATSRWVSPPCAAGAPRRYDRPVAPPLQLEREV